MTKGDIVLINGTIVRRILGMNKTSIIVFDDPNIKTLIIYPIKEAQIITMAQASKLLQQ